MLPTMSLVRNAFCCLHYPINFIAQFVRWYLAYALSLRKLGNEMNASQLFESGEGFYR